MAYKDKTYSYYLNANYANWENDHMKLTKEEYKMLKKMARGERMKETIKKGINMKEDEIKKSKDKKETRTR